MKIIVVGLGVQGRKRVSVAGEDVIYTVDHYLDDANFKDVKEVPLGDYDAALLCIPDEPKIEIIKYLLANKKHVLVEKPLLTDNPADLLSLQELAEANRVTCYTAYNHRFEPHFVEAKKIIESGQLGTIYQLRMFYGNGTARLVRNSPWRDQGAGVLPDLGSHLLDTTLFWLNRKDLTYQIQSAKKFENNSLDYVAFGANGQVVVQLEATLLSWRNDFYADFYAENGSLHIHSLCKWGPSTLTLRSRKLPSGRPDEKSEILVQDDPTWQIEYEHFKNICTKAESNLENDIWINQALKKLCKEA